MLHLLYLSKNISYEIFVQRVMHEAKNIYLCKTCECFYCCDYFYLVIWLHLTVIYSAATYRNHKNVHFKRGKKCKSFVLFLKQKQSFFRPATLWKRDSNAGVSVEFAKFSKFLRTHFFTKQLRWLLLLKPLSQKKNSGRLD